MNENKNSEQMINKDVVKDVARLSRLSFGDNDAELYLKQLSAILDYITQLQEVDTDDVQPTSHVIASMKNVFRADELAESLPNDQALQNAPLRKDGFFKVPRVI